MAILVVVEVVVKVVVVACSRILLANDAPTPLPLQPRYSFCISRLFLCRCVSGWAQVGGRWKVGGFWPFEVEVKLRSRSGMQTVCCRGCCSRNWLLLLLQAALLNKAKNNETRLFCDCTCHYHFVCISVCC